MVEPEGSETLTTNGIGNVWLGLERLAIEATISPTNERWKRLWSKDKPPRIAGIDITKTSADQTNWERRTVVYSAIDPLLVKKKKEDATDADEDPEELPEEDPRSEKVFRNPAGDLIGDWLDYGSWPPRIPSSPARITLVEFRLTLTELTSRVMALIAGAAENRFDVTKALTDPESKFDTPESIIERTCGSNPQLLGKNGNAPPSDTPMRNTEIRLRSDLSVQRLLKTAVVPTSFEQLQEAIRFLGDIKLGRKTIAEVTTPEAEELSELHASRFVAEELFLEARSKAESKESRIREANATTATLLQRANTYDMRRRRIAKVLYGYVKADPERPLTTEYQQLFASWRLLTAVSVDTCATVARAGGALFRDIFGGTQRELIEVLTERAPRRLAERDVVEPAVRRRRLREVKPEQLSLGLLRRNMEAEQIVAFETLAQLRDWLNERLTRWDEILLREIVTPLWEFIKPDRLLHVPDKHRLAQSATKAWKERYTRTKFPSLLEYVSKFVLPARVSKCVAEYRALVADHLSKVQGLPPEEKAETSSPLKPPKESLFKRGLRSYEALVAIRDIVLPTIDTPERRSRAIACVDLMFAGHLAATSIDPIMREKWVTAWRGGLTSLQQSTLLSARSRPDTDWFLAPEPAYKVEKGSEWRLGLDSKAISIDPPPTEQPLKRSYSGPATSWFYWVSELPRLVVPMEITGDTAYEEARDDDDWMDGITPSLYEDMFMTDEDLYDIGRARSTLPTIEVLSPSAAEAEEDNAIPIVAVPDKESVQIPDDAVAIINAWKITSDAREFDTPLWRILRNEVARTYVARFHPLVKKRGPLQKARKMLDGMEKDLNEIYDILSGDRMEVDGRKPEKLKKASEDKELLNRFRDTISNITGVSKPGKSK
jgi:hypothetical protein